MLVEADSFAWALPLAVVGIPVVLAFFYGFAAAVARLLWTDGIGRIAALAFGFGLAEWLRSFLFTGFPWNPIGLAAMPIPLLMQSVTVTGVIGMNALAVFVFAMPALAGVERATWRAGAVLALSLVAAHVGLRLYPPERAGGSGRKDAVACASCSRLSTCPRSGTTACATASSPRPWSSRRGRRKPGNAPPQLILWPETAVPFLFTERPDGLAAIGDMLGDGQMLMAGVGPRRGRRPAASEGPRYYNSVIADR